MKTRTILIIILLFSNVGFSQSFISKIQAESDINELLTKSKDIHPDLFGHISEEDFTSQLLDIPYKSDSVSIHAFKVHVAKTMSLLHDGHTHVLLNYKNQYSSIYETSVQNAILAKDGALYYRSKKGSLQKIESINGNINCYKHLISLVSGEIIGYREAELTRNFAFIYQFYYGSSKSLNLALIDENSVSVAITPKKQMQKFALIQPNDSLVVIQLNSFTLNTSESKEYYHFIDSTFAYVTHKSIPNLIIDVSENGGGNSGYGDYVMNYLTNKPYQTYQELSLKRSKTSKKYFRKRFLKWYLYPFAIFSKQARLVILKKPGTENLNPQAGTPVSKGILYTGKVSLITSEASYSAAGTFASSFKNSQVGLIYGSQTGQPCKGYIDLMAYKLPFSKVVITTSFKSYTYMGCDSQNAGIQPDIEVRKNINESSSSFYLRILSMDY